MKQYFFLVLATACIFSCNSRDETPDVSGIAVELNCRRFEQELFTLDTTRYAANLNQLVARYPDFGQNFLSAILNADPAWPADSLAAYVKGFTRAYQPVYDSARTVFNNFTPYLVEIEQMLRYVKYYFPAFQQRKEVITYIGPLDGYGDILSDDAIIIGLQHHLGKGFSLYQSAMVQEVYPEYISNRFEPGYIAVNCARNIINDLYPQKTEDKPLVQQMVQQGKRLYLLSKLLPRTPEYRIMGYTEEQLKAVYAHEAAVWDLFVQNNFLQTIDNNIIKNYIGESPKTPELGEGAPGNIGSFAGWQIVKKYMRQNPKTGLQQLMQTDDEMIFQQARYKP